MIPIFNVIRFFIIFSNIIKAIATIVENQKNLPELFSDMETNRPSNFHMANVYPRQETFMPFIPYEENARYLKSIKLVPIKYQILGGDGKEK